MTFFEKLAQCKIIPVAVFNKASDAVPTAEALSAGGLNCIEVTFRTDCAAQAIAQIVRALPHMLTGAGTVLSVEQAQQAIDAGASFIVSPGFNEAVVSFCIEKKIPIIPGVSTASEIEKAMCFGLSVLKFFPAEALGGINLIKALSAPYPHIKFMPTGGINEKNIKQYLALPSVIACGGSWMIQKESISQGNFTEITQKTAEALASLTPEAKTAPRSCATKRTNGETVTFGEIMMRLSPPEKMRFLQTRSFDLCYGGAEANVAASLACLHVPSRYVTVLPTNPLGESAVHFLRAYGIRTENIIRSPGRMGIYFLEQGAGQRSSQVVYDRKGSSIAEYCEPLNWKEIFKNAQWFHFTGITPALSPFLQKECMRACTIAKEMGLTISMDFNYRKKLWSFEQAKTVLAELCSMVDLCIANEEDAKRFFDLSLPHEDPHFRHIRTDDYTQVMKPIAEKWGFASLAITLRESLSASVNNWSALLYHQGTVFCSKKYHVHVVDRVGAGDSFAAGLIFAMQQHRDGQEMVDFATAASCLKHSIMGDFSIAGIEEIQRLAGGDSSGRVQR